MKENITETDILDALRHVDDPDLKKDLVTLGMVKNVRVSPGVVGFTVELTTPACPMKEMIRNACEQAIKLLVSPALKVEIEMTARVTAPQSVGLPGVRNLIAVASGKGGVGKSTVATNLAVALAGLGARVGLMDADLFGPSIPLMLGALDERPQVQTDADGNNKMVPISRYGVQLMSVGFLTDAGQSIIWRGPRASNVARQLLQDTLWDNLDYLIIDLPPGTSDIHITIAQQLPLNGALVVTTPQAVAVADARKAMDMFRTPAINVPILGVVENMSYFIPEDAPDKKYYIFGQGGADALAAEFNVPILGRIPLREPIREGGDAGAPAALQTDSLAARPFIDLAEQTARVVSILNARPTPQLA